MLESAVKPTSLVVHVNRDATSHDGGALGSLVGVFDYEVAVEGLGLAATSDVHGYV